MIKLKRAYEEAEPADGPRYLVDRLWPRGIAKDSLHIEDWLKTWHRATSCGAGSATTRANGMNSAKKYFAELKANPDAWAILAKAAKKRSITLVYSAKDTEHNNAVALAEFLTEPRP